MSRGEPLTADVVQAVLSWRDEGLSTVLAVREVKAGGALSLGEDGDLLVPRGALGASRVDVLRHAGEVATAFVPAGAALRVDGVEPEAPSSEVEVARGRIVEIVAGAFALRMERTPRVRRPAVAPLETLRRSGAGIVFGSAVLHAAAFAFVAFLAPSLAAAEEESDERDRIALMQRLLRSGEHETEPSTVSSCWHIPPFAPSGDAAAPPSDTGRAARQASHERSPGEAALPARDEVLAGARAFGAIGIQGALAGELPLAASTWGRVAVEDDTVGNMFGSTIGDASGDVMGSTSIGSGGGGRGEGISIGQMGPLGGGCAACAGVGTGRLQRAHVVRTPVVGEDRAEVNGRVPPETIQRIVRQNFGRFRLCYENGLRANPSLSGRVTVKFVINRQGGVAVAADGGSDLGDAGVRQCVVSSFTTLSFPEQEGTTTVWYPLVFTPEAS